MILRVLESYFFGSKGLLKYDYINTELILDHFDEKGVALKMNSFLKKMVFFQSKTSQ